MSKLSGAFLLYNTYKNHCPLSLPAYQKLIARWMMIDSDVQDRAFTVDLTYSSRCRRGAQRPESGDAAPFLVLNSA